MTQGRRLTRAWTWRARAFQRNLSGDALDDHTSTFTNRRGPRARRSQVMREPLASPTLTVMQPSSRWALRERSL